MWHLNNCSQVDFNASINFFWDHVRDIFEKRNGTAIGSQAKPLMHNSHHVIVELLKQEKSFSGKSKDVI